MACWNSRWLLARMMTKAHGDMFQNSRLESRGRTPAQSLNWMPPIKGDKTHRKVGQIVVRVQLALSVAFVPLSEGVSKGLGLGSCENTWLCGNIAFTGVNRLSLAAFEVTLGRLLASHPRHQQ
jgi:hypothetical protein